MQGLIDFATDIADGIAVVLPALCYLAALGCFMFSGWTLWTWSQPHRHHHHWHRPWVPFLSLVLCGVFASFPKFLSMTNVSLGTDAVVSLGQYAPTTPPNAGANVLGNSPQQSVLNVVQLFQYFFETFGAGCVFWAILRWRGIVNGNVQGSPTSCGIQFLFGACCMNVMTIATGVVRFFQAGS